VLVTHYLDDANAAALRDSGAPILVQARRLLCCALGTCVCV